MLRLLRTGHDPLEPDIKGVTPADLAGRARPPRPLHPAAAVLMADALRGWTPATHALYPAPIRRGVRLLLLLQARLHAAQSPAVLPHDVWGVVLAFLPRAWSLPSPGPIQKIQRQLSRALLWGLLRTGA